ncbi:DNA repair protein RadC [Limosilactobacillus frumenti DSM 13145]|uniref:DNA repair protein RadC n=1 Tax=Limosilactobacillus frumenti DSM 13145 TaxID=1423746 RepID=A0A0R1P803_9LACO|nr:JAB domain-containing protein [Limosilactobacillus frumenti]KRL28608.1 DNA repair protein RadC [Limosilactobacillus frumenti DSM 13145]MBA2914175.1 JAB domain-containing protein [Limosilactobacillus frumenti]QFG72324.1 JAB domain-containing protein [Limosilactobacillus frumenti]
MKLGNEQQYVRLVHTIFDSNNDGRTKLATNFLQKFPTANAVKNMDDEDYAECITWHPQMKSFLDTIHLGRLIQLSHRPLLGHAFSSFILSTEMMDLLADNDQETVLLVVTDVRNNIIDIQELFRGGRSECPLYPERVFNQALKKSAAGLAVVHNHPSGNVEPSAQDLVMAKRLHRGCNILGLQFLDFMIIGHESYYSWRENQRHTS